MKPVEDYNSVKEFVNEHRQMLERVLRHSSNAYARACTWALINAGSDAPDIDQLQRELQAAKEVDLGQKFSNQTAEVWRYTPDWAESLQTGGERK